MSTRIVQYNFEFENEINISYRVAIDESSMIMQTRGDIQAAPDWTTQKTHSCGDCPIKKQKHCPIALNLWDILDTFKSVKSFLQTTVTVTTEERVFKKETDIQTGLGSLLGLIIATSGCPTMDFLRPMARFHLPFASTEETVFRSFGSFLIGEYLKGDISKDSITEELLSRYEKINKINKNLLQRIKPLTSKSNAGDADQNAIIILDTFATMLSIQLTDNISLLNHLYESNKKQKKP